MNTTRPPIRWAAFAARKTVVQPWESLFWGARSRGGQGVRCQQCHQRIKDPGLGMVTYPSRWGWLADGWAGGSDPRFGTPLCMACCYTWYGFDARDLPSMPSSSWVSLGPVILRASIRPCSSPMTPRYGYQLGAGWRRRLWGSPKWHLISVFPTPSRCLVWPVVVGGSPSKTPEDRASAAPRRVGGPLTGSVPSSNRTCGFPTSGSPTIVAPY